MILKLYLPGKMRLSFGKNSLKNAVEMKYTISAALRCFLLHWRVKRKTGRSAG